MSIYLLLLLGLGLVVPALAAGPVITYEIIKDTNNNTAYANGTIVWGGFPPGDEYQTSTEYDAGAIAAFYDMARAFLNVIQSKDLPYDIIAGVMDGSFSIADNYMDLVMYALGFFICFLCGVLFIIIMPILGCCFCCCRQCGNCGGARKQKLTNNSNVKCMCFATTLIITTVFVIAGVACTMSNSGQISIALKNFGKVTETNLNDVSSFMNNTIEELKFAGVDNFEFTVAVVEGDLDSIGALLGVPIRDELDEQVNIETALDAVTAFETQINTIGSALRAVNASIESVKANGETLKTNISSVKTDIDAAKLDVSCIGCGTLDTSDMEMDVDFNSLPDISDEMQSLEDAQSKNLSALVEDGRKEFNNIPWKVHNETLSTVTTLKGQLNSFKTTIGNAIAEIEKFPSQLTGTLDGAKGTISGFTGMIDPYYDYIGYAGLALPGIFLLIGILQTMGIVFGIIGYKRTAKPTERECLSNSGGNMLMAATAFTFMFSWLFMFLTCILFLIGGNLEVLLCRTLVDPDYKVFKEMIDKPGFMGDPGEYYLGKAMFKNGSIPLTAYSVLEGCRNNGPAFEVFMLDKYPGFSLDLVTDYKKNIDIDSQIDAIDVPLNDVEIMSPELEQQLRDFSDSVQLNYTGFRDELTKNTVKFNFTEKVTLLRAAAVTSTPPADASLTGAADTLELIETGNYQTVKDDQAQLLTDIDNLESSTAGIPVAVNNTIDALNSTEYNLEVKGITIVKAEAKKYGNRILGVADSFVNNTLKLVTEDMGRCKPVWNLWESLIHVALCKYAIDSFNAIWFGMGWCLFFMTVSIIFNVKLAKYLRRMDVLDAMDYITMKIISDDEIYGDDAIYRNTNYSNTATAPPMDGTMPQEPEAHKQLYQTKEKSSFQQLRKNKVTPI